VSAKTEKIDNRILVTAREYVTFMQSKGPTEIGPRVWEAYYAPMSHLLTMRKGK
jgi:hypothetical protein